MTDNIINFKDIKNKKQEKAISQTNYNSFPVDRLVAEYQDQRGHILQEILSFGKIIEYFENNILKFSNDVKLPSSMINAYVNDLAIYLTWIDILKTLDNRMKEAYPSFDPNPKI